MKLRKIAGFGIAAVLAVRLAGALSNSGDLETLRLAQAYSAQAQETRNLFAEVERAPEPAVSTRSAYAQVLGASLLSSVTEYTPAAAQEYQPEPAPIVAAVKSSKPEKSKPSASASESKPQPEPEPESYYQPREIPQVPEWRKPIETSAPASKSASASATCRDASGRFAACPASKSSKPEKSKPSASKSSACPASKPIRAEDGSCVPTSFYSKTDYNPVKRTNTSARDHDFFCKPDGCYVTVFATGKTHKLPKQYAAEDSGYMGWLRSKGFAK